MEHEYPIAIWEIGSRVRDLRRLIEEAESAALAPSVFGMEVADYGDRFSLLLAPGSRPSLTPETTYLVQAKGICRLLKCDVLDNAAAPRFMLRLTCYVALG